MKESPSYNISSCCNQHCVFYHDQETYGQCWGDVEVSHEDCCVDLDGNMDWYWVHACQGHRDMSENYNNEYYIKENNDQQ
jgi:hypothetical protein